MGLNTMTVLINKLGLLGVACALSACGGGGGSTATTPTPVSYTSLSDTTKATPTTVTVVRGSPSAATSTVAGSFNHMSRAVTPTGGIAKATTAGLTTGLNYVTTIGNVSDQLAMVPTVATDLPTGSATYTGAAAINVISTTDMTAYDDPTGTASVAVTFGATPTAVGTFAVTAGTATDNSANVTPANGTVKVSGLTLPSGTLSGTGATVEITGLGVANLTGATVTAAGGFAGPQAAEIGGVVKSSDSDTSLFVTFAGKK